MAFVRQCALLAGRLVRGPDSPMRAIAHSALDRTFRHRNQGGGRGAIFAVLHSCSTGPPREGLVGDLAFPFSHVKPDFVAKGHPHEDELPKELS